MTIHLSILIFWPLALALLGAVLAPGRFAALFALLGAAVPFAYAVVALLDYDTARGGLQYVTDDAWIRQLGILIAHALYVRNPAQPAAIRTRFAGAHRLFVNKWYFDELIELLIVRPGAWSGRFARDTFERVVVQGTLVGGASRLVGAAGSAVRAGQSGYLRYYAALLLVGLTGLGAYFLISA